MNCKVDVTENIALIIEQYKNTVNLKKLISGLLTLIQQKLIEPLCIYQLEMNIDQAKGFLIDRIGGIFGYKRPLIDSGQFVYFGFDGNGLGFDMATFVPDGGTADFYEAGDDLYRTLLKAWIGGLFTDGTLPSINKVIQLALGASGGHVIDNGNMTADVYLFNVDINLLYTIAKTNVIPRPAGVAYNYNLATGTVFGFDGNGVGFDQAPFITVLEGE